MTGGRVRCVIWIGSRLRLRVGSEQLQTGLPRQKRFSGGRGEARLGKSAYLEDGCGSFGPIRDFHKKYKFTKSTFMCIL
jgi:hypothetical protein